MKQVVNINQLYVLIPETRELEGISFKDIRELLMSIIEKVEKSGKWEFVQYMSGNPSFFIVKEKDINVSHDTVTTAEVTLKKNKKEKNPDLIKEEKIESLSEFIQKGGNTLFPDIKMPW